MLKKLLVLAAGGGAVYAAYKAFMPGSAYGATMPTMDNVQPPLMPKTVLPPKVSTVAAQVQSGERIVNIDPVRANIYSNLIAR